MERRKGIVLDDSFPDGVEQDQELCHGISRTLVDTLVELHAVDVEKAGLGDLGKPDGFLQRQTEGWISRYEKAKTDEIEEVGLSRPGWPETSPRAHPRPSSTTTTSSITSFWTRKT